jgi:uracil-DNA glycosylase family 4
MDARERLRLYLEQRRELGESELVLDALPVDDVLALVGARRLARPGATASAAPSASPRGASDRAPRQAAPDPSGPGRDAAANVPPADQPAAPPSAPRPRFDPASGSRDWRAALREQAVGDGSRIVRPDRPGGGDAWLEALGLPAGRSIGAALPAPAAGRSLDAVVADVAACTACPLGARALNHVPGEGNPQAEFVCIGEAPGQTEDETGRPFVGAAGQLLDKILAAIRFDRRDVFIANVLKHRPPGNRTPSPDEMRACRPFLEEQLALLHPRVILALGTTAAHALLDTTETLGALRGRVHRWHGIPLIVTYHPSALLRNEAWKRPAWEDVQLARRVFDAAREANPA